MNTSSQLLENDPESTEGADAQGKVTTRRKSISAGLDGTISTISTISDTIPEQKIRERIRQLAVLYLPRAIQNLGRIAQGISTKSTNSQIAATLALKQFAQLEAPPPGRRGNLSEMSLVELEQALQDSVELARDLQALESGELILPVIGSAAPFPIETAGGGDTTSPAREGVEEPPIDLEASIPPPGGQNEASEAS